VNTAFVEGLHLALRCGDAAMATTAVLVAVLLRTTSGIASEPTQPEEPAYQSGGS
jgi:hypothetical protein